MQVFTFDSTGGCARCDGMDAEHEQYPIRPHPYCDCKITAKDKDSKCYEAEINMFGDGEGVEKGNEVIFTFELRYEIHLKCVESDKSKLYSLDAKDVVTMERSSYPGKDQLLKELSDTYLIDDVAPDIETEALELCGCT